MNSGTHCCGEVAAEPISKAALQTLIPIAVVIAAGCETCAQRMVERALGEDTPVRLIRQTLATVAYVRSQECLARAVGVDVVARMEAPLEAGIRTLRTAQDRARAEVGRQ